MPHSFSLLKFILFLCNESNDNHLKYICFMQTKITYPQYRKYANNTCYFKIISSSEWEEIRVIGSNYSFHHFTATILPDRNYIYDLTFDYEKNWVAIEEEEYDFFKSKVEK